MRQKRCDGLYLIQDLWSPLVGDPHDQGVWHVIAGFLLAQGKDGRAGRVRNCMRIAQVFVSRSQGMERKKVQGAVGHKDQMFGVEVFADGSNKFRVEGFNSTFGRRDQGLLKTLSISTAPPKFLNLQADHVKKVQNAAHYADRGLVPPVPS